MIKGFFIKTLAVAGLMVIFTTNAVERDLSLLQKEFLSWKFGMFMHFNMSTFVPGGWSSGKEDPLLFKPTNLDFNQWADAAVSANMKYGVLTVKHTGGWSLWQSDVAERDMEVFKNYQNGQGDIVAEYTQAFRAKNLKVGLYYCFPLFSPRWANYETLSSEGYAKGEVNALNFIKDQFTELLTNYGTIDLVWIDQAFSKNGGLKKGDWLEIKNHIHALQPNTIVIANNHIDYATTDIHSFEYPYSLELPSAGNSNATEIADKLQQGWFTSPKGDSNPVRNVDYVVNKMLRPLNSNNSNYLLNVAPNQKGLIPEDAVKLLAEVGKEWHPNESLKVNENVVGITQKMLTTVANDKDNISLLFDISKNVDNLANITNILSKNNILASFVVSENTVKSSAKQLRELVMQGHTLVNGSKKGIDLTALASGRKIRDEIESLQKLTLSKANIKPLLFKSPKNKYNSLLWDVLNYQGLVGISSSLKVDTAKRVDNLSVKSGAIIEVVVDNSGINALSPLLTKLTEQGLTAVPIEYMMGNASAAWIREKSKSKANVVSGVE